MAFATLLSITQSLEQILHSDNRSLTLHETEQHIMRSLSEKGSLLLSFLENDSLKYSESNLEPRIRDVAYKAEAMIESRFLYQSRSKTKTHCFWEIFCVLLNLIPGFHHCEPSDENLEFRHDNLEKIVEELDSILEEVVKMKEMNQVKYMSQTKSTPSASSESGSIDKTRIVGLRKEMMDIKDRLTGSPPRREIISIVGMPGIGKTTLAKTLYDDPVIVQRFDVRAWITVSHDFHLQQMLTDLLDSIQNINHGSYPEDLATHLHQTLKGRRYLIVMDDVWDTNAWEQVKRLFPHDGNASRVILTTRLLDVADHVECPESIYCLSLLSSDDSWKLLCQEAFEAESCPPAFEEVGKEIANNCKGLPLSLAVIGGILCKAERTINYWRYVAQNVNYALNKTDDHVMSLLSLSYKHLPHHLRACFLYMGAFPEDHEISKSKLIVFWVAEGFIKPVPSKSLEDVAREYLDNLIDRNMILIRTRNYAGGIKKCGMHDLMRDLCVRIAEEEKFLKVVNSQLIQDYQYNFRHVYMHLDSHNLFAGIYGFVANSLLDFATESPNADLLSSLLNSHHLRVLDAQENPFSKLQNATMDQVGLRYISFRSMENNYKLPSSISTLSNLETLVIITPGEVVLPLEIWTMPRIRHIKANKCFLLDPFDAENGENFVQLENLQTLKRLMNFRFTEDAIGMMPNLKKLGIRFYLDRSDDLSRYCIVNLVLLRQLESLDVFFDDKSDTEYRSRYPLPENFRLPPSLRKLTLSGFRLSPKHMASIGLLEHLEQLSLKQITFDGLVWEPNVGEFLKLKSLYIHETNVECFVADETNFPILESLRIFDCYELEEIPSGFGYIRTLGLLEVFGCGKPAEDSLELIRKEQQELGNDRLRIINLGGIRISMITNRAAMSFIQGSII